MNLKFLTHEERQLPFNIFAEPLNWYELDFSKIRFQDMNDKDIHCKHFIGGMKCYPMFYIDNNTQFYLRINGSCAVDHSKHDDDSFKEWTKNFLALRDSYYDYQRHFNH